MGCAIVICSGSHIGDDSFLGYLIVVELWEMRRLAISGWRSKSEWRSVA
ncbi:MAG: hypothetical protein HC881_00265 [Leptolyngbyaceae cyanobacterium SL_7_1]|nr:hypothetical protein [Leptolyngbyaceae cyanobacterium SL_7_1]